MKLDHQQENMTDIEALEAEFEKLRKENRQLRERVETLEENQNSPRISSTRRQFLGGAVSAGLGAAGVWALTGRSAAQTGGSWSSATGEAGTQSDPLTGVWARDAYHQTLEVDQDATVHGSLSTGELSLIGPGTNPFVSTESDFSDISTERQVKNPTSQTDYTLVNVSDGPKVAYIGMTGDVDSITDTSDTTGKGRVTVTRDGTTTTYPPEFNANRGQDAAGDTILTADGPLFRYESSLRVDWRHLGDGDRAFVYCFRIDDN